MEDYCNDAQSMKDDERIENYLAGLMDEGEEAKFLEELNSNVELREKAIIQARLIKGMQEVDEQTAEALKNVDKDSIAAMIKPKKHNHVAKWISIAASIVIICGAGFTYYDYHHVTSMGLGYANMYPMPDVIRGDENMSIRQELDSLFSNIEHGENIKETVQRLEILWDASQSETYNDYTDYSEYIGWHLAMGYLQQYKKKEAKKMLKNIGDSELIGKI